MNLGKLERFAQMARRELHKQVKARLDVVLQPQSLERRELPSVVRQLDQEIAETSRDKVVARVAYTWFNRFCALRFMDVNGYNRVRVVSPSEGFIQPELLTEAKQGMLPEEWFTENPPALERVRGLLEGRIPSQSPEQEAYALLLVAACNSLHKAMPYLFEAINDVTELLLPADLLSPNAVLTYVRDTLDTESCESVEVIGWLYQFYISEIKDKVMGAKAAVAQDDIPAVTQLFTPRWIVGYLVENSLGRLWLQNRPQSKLRASMKYYLEEAEPVPFEGPKLSSPKDIRLMDPACGSGHILVYAFDLLVEIYREEGFEDHEIAGLILEHNLVGLDIDERAAELASFALTMKARSLSRRFLSNPVQPKVCALSAPGLKTSELEDYQKRVGKDLFSPGILSTLKQWEDAPHFGALIRPKAGDVEALRQKLSNLPIQEDLVLAPTHAKILKTLEQIALVGAKVHCVVANPPYMGGRKMNSNLKKFVSENYPISKDDLMTCFMERGLEMCRQNGRLAMINLPSWMFLSSYEKLRKSILSRSHIESLVQNGRGIFGADFGSVAFVLRNATYPDAKTQCRRLFVEHVQVDSIEEKEARFLDPTYGHYTVHQSSFEKMPGSPIAFWLGTKLLKVFEESRCGDSVFARQGLATGDNSIFMRLWSEVSMRDFYALARSCEETSSLPYRWYPYNKGGSFRRWYGNIVYVVDWKGDGAAVRAFKDEYGRSLSYPRNASFYFREGLTWSDVTSGKFSARYLPVGNIYDVSGHSAFSDGKVSILKVLAYANTGFCGEMSKVLNPTIHFQVGDFSNLPFPSKFITKIDVKDAAIPAHIAKLDWDSYETSWDFPGHPLLSQGHWTTQPNGRLRLPGETDAENPNSIDLSVQWPALKGVTLAESYAAWRSFAEQQTAELKRLEEENNRLFIDAYGLQGELTPEVPLKEITLTVNPVYRFGEGKSTDEYDKLCREAAAKELISYAIGCLFGRYSLDRPGLILANAGETLEDFHAKVPGARFLPDSDNVIPLLEEDWFEDDLYARLKEWLKVAWGPTTLEQNLSWLEEALGKDLRKYLARDFYKDHVSTYRKRPIYWLFQSPAGSFQALVYLHRYTADTVGVVLNDYVRQFVAKLEGHRKMLLDQSIDPNATQGQKTKALKELDRVRKQLEDLNDYDRDILFPLASARIALDLDDGVRVNYPKLGAALKRIPGLEGEE